MIRYRLHIQPLAKATGIENANLLWKAMGGGNTGISKATAYELWEGTKTMYKQDTIDLICDILHCSPGSLFVPVEGKATAKKAARS